MAIPSGARALRQARAEFVAVLIQDGGDSGMPMLELIALLSAGRVAQFMTRRQVERAVDDLARAGRATVGVRFDGMHIRVRRTDGVAA